MTPDQRLDRDPTGAPELDLGLFDLIESSYRRVTGRALADVEGDATARARWVLDRAPFGLLAHDGGDDPRFTYCNRTAQGCFEYPWEEFVGMPSRLSARPEAQEDRDDLLARVEAHGFAEGYRGPRVARSGRRFWIEDVVMWNLVDDGGTRRGQAAMFPRWSDAVDEPEGPTCAGGAPALP